MAKSRNASEARLGISQSLHNMILFFWVSIRIDAFTEIVSAVHYLFLENSYILNYS